MLELRAAVCACIYCTVKQRSSGCVKRHESISPAEEERALNNRPPPSPFLSLPSQLLHSKEETEKTKHTRRFIISKLRGRGKNRAFSFYSRTCALFLVSLLPREKPGPAAPLFPYFAYLFPSCLQLAKAPALSGKKANESDRRRRERCHPNLPSRR